MLLNSYNIEQLLANKEQVLTCSKLAESKNPTGYNMLRVIKKKTLGKTVYYNSRPDFTDNNIN